MFLDKETFTTIIKNTPLISIDLVVKNTEGKYLFGYRSNRPAKGFWFVPGGRILKNETMENAFERICQQELGVYYSKNDAKFLGPFEHFYDDCVFTDEFINIQKSISTHYIVLAYEITVNIDIGSLPDNQHDRFKWFSKEDVINGNDMHKHSKWYFY